MEIDSDLSVRLTAFDWLSEQTRIHGDVLPRKVLEDGYLLNNERIHLLSPQGIFKPRILELPLSITTAPKGPYEDSYSSDGFVNYKYRGTDPNHKNNVGLRKLIEAKRPLVYFHGIVPGQYLAVWPVYIVGEDPPNLAFKVAVDDVSSLKQFGSESHFEGPAPDIRRAYLTSLVKQRLHQRLFRERVLDAYRSRCSFCNLKHRELLDAAHIVPDTDPIGEPKIVNGLALCKLHHAAFDSFMLAVSPDYVIHVREDILEESDGPILQHGLQRINQSKLILPPEKSNWPGQSYLE
ncbi:HNH endonuclease [bacterium]|nr:HNH endonuclease [bacterium]